MSGSPQCSTVAVGPCPFCGNELYRSPRAHNPKAYCVTEDCYGKRMSVVNLDDPVCVAMWNARAGCGGVAQAAPMPWPSREIVAREIRRAMLDNPTAGTFNKREAERERVADDAADAILARFEQSRAQPAQATSVSSTQKQTPANFVTIPTNLAQRLRDHLQQADSFVWLDEIQMLDAALLSTNGKTP